MSYGLNERSPENKLGACPQILWWVLTLITRPKFLTTPDWKACAARENLNNKEDDQAGPEFDIA